MIKLWSRVSRCVLSFNKFDENWDRERSTRLGNIPREYFLHLFDTWPHEQHPTCSVGRPLHSVYCPKARASWLAERQSEGRVSCINAEWSCRREQRRPVILQEADQQDFQSLKHIWKWLNIWTWLCRTAWRNSCLGESRIFFRWRNCFYFTNPPADALIRARPVC